MANPYRALCFLYLIGTAFLATSVAGSAIAADNNGTGKTVGYLLTGFIWGTYQTPSGKDECPQGLGVGLRDQIKAQFPNAVAGKLAPDGLTLEQVMIRREAANFWPELAAKEKDLTVLPWRYVEGKISYGLNLDGKIGPNDFTSPDGVPGVDNQLYRVLGCADAFRETGSIASFGDTAVRTLTFDLILMELTHVDSLVNDDSVDVTFYRGLDRVVIDNAGHPVAHTTQRIDMKRGAMFVTKLHGKIVNGVLVTEPGDLVLPWNSVLASVEPVTEWIRGARLEVKLTPDNAEGLIGGYADIDTFYDAITRARISQQQRGFTTTGLYRELHAFADGYPDPATGANTAISSAIRVKFVQAYIEHPPSTSARAEGRSLAAAK